MAVTDMEWTEIFKSIKCSRAIANPNPGFKRQLNDFGKSEELKAVSMQKSASITRIVPVFFHWVPWQQHWILKEAWFKN
jgi:hypothetical protein